MSEWSGVGVAYDASYAELCAGTGDAVIAALGTPDGRALLDVGSGTGILASRLRDAGWSVTGCEPEPTMRDIAVHRDPGIVLEDAALPSLPFPDAGFDAVTANFVLNHVPDPRAAAAEMRRVAAPGARLVATTWTASPNWFWTEVCARAGLVPPVGPRLPAELDFERTAAGFARMLRDGRWSTVEVSELTWTWQARRSSLWASAEGGVASAGAYYRSLAGADRALFRDAFEEVCEAKCVDGRVPLTHTAAVAAGRAG